MVIKASHWLLFCIVLILVFSIVVEAKKEDKKDKVKIKGIFEDIKKNLPFFSGEEHKFVDNQSTDVLVPSDNGSIEDNVTPTNSPTDPTDNSSIEENVNLTNYTLACTESWDCTDWSVCIEDHKERDCTDKNDCGTSIHKPKEKVSCIDDDLEKSNLNDTDEECPDCLDLVEDEVRNESINKSIPRKLSLRKNWTVLRLREKEKINVNIAGKPYELTIGWFTPNESSISVYNLNFILRKGKEKSIDLDSNSLPDVDARYEGMEENLSIISFKAYNLDSSINQIRKNITIPGPGSARVTDELKGESGLYSIIKGLNPSKIILSVSGIILAIILLLMMVSGKNKKENIHSFL